MATESTLHNLSLISTTVPMLLRTVKVIQYCTCGAHVGADSEDHPMVNSTTVDVTFSPQILYCRLH